MRDARKVVCTMDLVVGAARLYDPSDSAGYRVLVDRLWPRGVRKENANWDLWLKEAAPSSALRRWYHLNRDEEPLFRARYREELASGTAGRALTELADLVRAHGGALLVTSARDLEHSHVPVLRAAVLEVLGQG